MNSSLSNKSLTYHNLHLSKSIRARERDLVKTQNLTNHVKFDADVDLSEKMVHR